MRFRSLVVCLSLLSLQVSAAEQRLSLQGAEYAIPAVLALPDGRARGSVVLLHGTASNKDEVGGLFRRLADLLRTRGIASLRIDFAGSGDSPVGHRRYTLSGAVRDASLAIDALREHAALADKPLAVLGFSQGGLIAQRVTLAKGDVAALVTWSTVAADGDAAMRDFVERYYAEARRTGVARISFDWLPAPLEFSLQWFEELRAQRTLSEMRSYGGPILAVAGLADDVVPHTQSAALVAQSPHAASRAVLLAGANHIFNALAERSNGASDARSDRQLLQITSDFLLHQMPAPSP